MKQVATNITEKRIYRLLKQDWHVPVRRSKAASLALSDLGFTEMEVNWLLNSIEWKYSISINVESVPLQTSIESFVQQIVSAPHAAA